jgi:hypothetical protein
MEPWRQMGVRVNRTLCEHSINIQYMIHDNKLVGGEKQCWRWTKRPNPTRPQPHKPTNRICPISETLAKIPIIFNPKCFLELLCVLA